MDKNTQEAQFVKILDFFPSEKLQNAYFYVKVRKIIRHRDFNINRYSMRKHARKKSIDFRLRRTLSREFYEQTIQSMTRRIASVIVYKGHRNKY